MMRVSALRRLLLLGLGLAVAGCDSGTPVPPTAIVLPTVTTLSGNLTAAPSPGTARNATAAPSPTQNSELRTQNSPTVDAAAAAVYATITALAREAAATATAASAPPATSTPGTAPPVPAATL